MTDEPTQIPPEEIVQPTEATFEEAVLDMGALFSKMQRQYKVPPAVTMDIVRLQLMYMQTNAATAQIPPTAPPEVIMAEQFEAQEEDE